MSSTRLSRQNDSTPYEDHIIGAGDTCRNCLSLVRVERIDPMRAGLVQEYQTTLARRRRSTSVEYAPAEASSEMKGVFCDCGAENPRHRVWDDEGLELGRFRELVKNMIRTAEIKGISVKRFETSGYAIQAFKDGMDPDNALAQGLDSGIVAAAAGD